MPADTHSLEISYHFWREIIFGMKKLGSTSVDQLSIVTSVELCHYRKNVKNGCFSKPIIKRYYVHRPHVFGHHEGSSHNGNSDALLNQVCSGICHYPIV